VPAALRLRDAVISLGSNVRVAHSVPWALTRLGARFHEVRSSPAYAGEAVGPPGQLPFVNLVVRCTTDLPLAALRAVLRHLETLAGRQRSEDRFAPRTLDLDVLRLVGPEGQEHLEAADLVHAHVLVPWADLQPRLVLPDEARTLAERAAPLRQGLPPWDGGATVP
jgi:2-amino-4-hydroxy-6-hydroxymethyldihydropteridine diphosphokinase